MATNGIIANFSNYNAGSQVQLLAEAIAIIDESQQQQQGVYQPQSPTYSPTTPPPIVSMEIDDAMEVR